MCQGNNVFLFENHGDHAAHETIFAEGKQLDEITKAGIGVVIENKEYDNIRQRAKESHAAYTSKRLAIRDSEDPRHTDDTKRYDMNKLDEEYEAGSREIAIEWENKREEFLEAAQQRAVTATVAVSDEDKLTASQFATRAMLDISTSIGDTQRGFVSKLTKNIGRLTDAQKVALQPHILDITRLIEDEHHARTVVGAVQKLRNQDLLADKVARGIPRSVLIEYQQARRILDGDNVATKFTTPGMRRDRHEADRA